MELVSRTAPSAATTFVTPAGWRYAASRPAVFAGRVSASVALAAPAAAATAVGSFGQARPGLRGVGRPVTAVGTDTSAMRGADALAMRGERPNTNHKSIQHNTCVVESTALGAELEPPPLRAPR